MPGTTAFPASVDAFPEIGPGTQENTPGAEHDVVHANVHAAIVALQEKVGVDASTDPASIDARLAAVEGSVAPSGLVHTTGDEAIAGVKTFASSPVVPTPAAGDNSTKAASTAFITGALASYVPLASFTFANLGGKPNTLAGFGIGDAVASSSVGAANGVAPLGSDGKIASAYIPTAVLGQIEYKGTWDATSGAPTATPETGWYYIVQVAGSTNLSGITDWKVGDWAVYNGAAWDKVDNTDAISSWNGRAGAVVPQTGDYTPAQVGAEPAITSGTTAQFWRGDKSWQDLAAAVRAVVITGLSTATNAAIAATDSILVALGKLQAQINTNATAITAKADDSAVVHNAGAETVAGNKTFSGALTVTSGSASMSAAAGTNRSFRFQTSLVDRWVFGASGVAESGSNVGSEYFINAYTDAGVLLYTPITIFRNPQTARVRCNFEFSGDNTLNLGAAGFRIKEIFCGNAVINTSDAREKTAIRPLSDAEIAASRDIAGMAGIFQWLASVEAKGESARLHVGAIAQQVVAAMQGRGLDPFRYGFVCFDEWTATEEAAEYEDVMDDEGAPTGERRLLKPAVVHAAGSRYGLRYGELSMFLLAAQEQRLRTLEAALGALS
jgi:hypothetical protein